MASLFLQLALILVLVAQCNALAPRQDLKFGSSDSPPDIDHLDPKYGSKEEGQIYEMHEDSAKEHKQTFETQRFLKETEVATTKKKPLPSLESLKDDPGEYNTVAVKKAARKGQTEGWSELTQLAEDYKEKHAALVALQANVSGVETSIKDQRDLIAGFGKMKNALLNMIGKSDVVLSSMKHQAEAVKATATAQLNLVAASEKDMTTQHRKEQQIQYDYNRAIQEAELRAAQTFAELRSKESLPAEVDYSLATMLTTDENAQEADLKMKVATDTAMRDKLATIQRQEADYLHEQQEATQIEKARLNTALQKFQSDTDKMKKESIDAMETNLEQARTMHKKATTTQYGHTFVSLIGSVNPAAAAAAAGPLSPQAEVEKLDSDSSYIVDKAKTEAELEKKLLSTELKMTTDKQQTELAALTKAKAKIDELDARMKTDLKHVRMFSSQVMSGKGVAIEHINEHMPSFADNSNGPEDTRSEVAKSVEHKSPAQIVSQMEKIKSDFNAAVGGGATRWETKPGMESKA